MSIYESVNPKATLASHLILPVYDNTKANKCKHYNLSHYCRPIILAYYIPKHLCVHRMALFEVSLASSIGLGFRTYSNHHILSQLVKISIK